jgi:hypothetical protein
MRRYFVNPELKRSSVVLLFLNIIFMLGTILTLKLYQNSLKQDYIKTFGYITVIISQNNPEIIREIAPIITKGINNRDAEEGERILKQYGLTKELENNLFPYINKSNQKYNWYIADIFMVMVFVFFILNYIQCGYFYKRIRRINLGAKKIIDGDYNISINENKEGDFSKLSTSFNSMREIIKNSINELKSEKQFLVDLLSDISHQLKTPLSSMIIYNDILLK